MRAKLFRLAWRIASLKMGKGKEIIPAPKDFLTFSNFSAFEKSDLFSPLCVAYQRVFQESTAWQENHSCESIYQKLNSQLIEPCSITIMLEKSETDVKGFCWGQVLNTEKVFSECQESISFNMFEKTDWEKLSQALNRVFLDKEFLFIHELGILQRHRNGLQPLRFLIRPSLELGNHTGTKKLLWWTNKQSEAYKLSALLGLEVIFDTKGIIFLYLPDYIPLLESIRYIDAKELSKLMEKLSFSSHKRKGMAHERSN